MEGPKLARLCAVSAVSAVLIATLWPMSPFQWNGVSWPRGKSGLRFEKAGLVVSKAPLKPPSANDSQSYTLELLLRPATVESSSAILAFYNPVLPRQLLITQLKNGLGVAYDSQIESEREIDCDIGHVFEPGTLVLVAISSGADGVTFFVNGQRRYSFPKSRISSDQLSGDVLLGSSPLTYQPWSGEIYGFAIYARGLTDESALQHYQAWMDPNNHIPDLDHALSRYTFSEGAGTTIHNQVGSEANLEIPPTFFIPHKVFLRSPVQEFRPDWQYAVDVISNIAGFVPLGLIVYVYLNWTKTAWKAALLTIVLCGMLSLMIEVAQYYIPPRGSGITDIITNTLGGALGAALAQIPSIRRQLRKMKLARAEDKESAAGL